MMNQIVKKHDGIWFVVDTPNRKTIELSHGVLSVRGWAWSREHGRGQISLKIKPKVSDIEGSCIPVEHRFCRVDVSREIPEIPIDSYCGFEISIDRFKLATHSEIFIHFLSSGGEYALGPMSIKVENAHPIGRTIDVEICDCCAKQDFNLLGEKDGLPISVCNNCRLVFTSSRPELSKIHERYSKDYFDREYLEEIHDLFPDRQRHWNNILDHLERFKDISPNLYEIGTGAGYLLKEAAHRNWVVSGLDYNPQAAEYAQRLGLDVMAADIEEIEINENHYGAIILESVLEHFVSPLNVLKKCSKALLPGGGLFIWTLSNEGNLFTTLGMDFKYIGPSEHLYYFPGSTLLRLCEQAGLIVEHFWRDATNDSVALVATKRLDIWD